MAKAWFLKKTLKDRKMKGEMCEYCKFDMIIRHTSIEINFDFLVDNREKKIEQGFSNDLESILNKIKYHD